MNNFVLTSVKCKVDNENGEATYVLYYTCKRASICHSLEFIVQGKEILTFGTFEELTDLYK